jgi:hypothetical protein
LTICCKRQCRLLLPTFYQVYYQSKSIRFLAISPLKSRLAAIGLDCAKSNPSVPSGSVELLHPTASHLAAADDVKAERHEAAETGIGISGGAHLFPENRYTSAAQSLSILNWQALTLRGKG